MFASSALVAPAIENEKLMKKARSKSQPELKAEYDFSGGVRGKHARRYAQGTNVIVLEPDVAKIFPTPESANQALRALAGVIKLSRKTA